MKKSDIIFSFIIGEVIALFFIDILKEVAESNRIFHLVLYSLPFIFPFLSVFCLWLAYLIGKKFLFVYQLAKFCLVGALATVLDIGALSIFMEVSGRSAGWHFSLYKAISFVIATTGKYFIDKFWAFEKKERKEMGIEFSKFFTVTIIGMGLNVLVASFMVALGPHFSLSSEAWGKFAGLVAVLVVFIWNFLGYKFIVFKV